MSSTKLVGRIDLVRLLSLATDGSIWVPHQNEISLRSCDFFILNVGLDGERSFEALNNLLASTIIPSQRPLTRSESTLLANVAALANG